LLRRFKLSCQGQRPTGVSDHRSVYRVGEVSLEDPDSFAAGVAIRSGVIV
jgi:hypothetical protein